MMKIKFITPIKLFIQSKRCCVCVYGVCPFCRSLWVHQGLVAPGACLTSALSGQQKT